MSHPTFDLSLHGVENPGTCHWNTRTTQLVEMALKRGEGVLARNGALSVSRPADGWPRFRPMVVSDSDSSSEVDWTQECVPLDTHLFTILFGRLLSFLQGRELFVQDRELGVHDSRKIRVRVISTTAHHALLSHLVLRPFSDSIDPFFPDFTIFFAPDFRVSSVVDQISGSAASVIDLSKRLGLILGTGDTEEFSRMVFRLLSFDFLSQGRPPLLGTVLQTRFSDDAALVLGSSTSERLHLAFSACEAGFENGDDSLEISFDGPIIVREGGMDILANGATSPIGDIEMALSYPFGTLVESSGLNPDSRTLLEPENAVISWPAICLPQCSVRKVTPPPRSLFLAIRDGSGALPPISKISPCLASKIFAVGPSADVALSPSGDEGGGGLETVFSFDACFSGGALLRSPRTLASALFRRLVKSGTKCWLVNLGNVFRDDGSLSEFSQTNLCRLVRGAISGALDQAKFRRDEILGCSIPISCEGFSCRDLDPLGTLKDHALDSWKHAAEALSQAMASRGVQFCADSEEAAGADHSSET